VMMGWKQEQRRQTRTDGGARWGGVRPGKCGVFERSGARVGLASVHSFGRRVAAEGRGASCARPSDENKGACARKEKKECASARFACMLSHTLSIRPSVFLFYPSAGAHACAERPTPALSWREHTRCSADLRPRPHRSVPTHRNHEASTAAGAGTAPVATPCAVLPRTSPTGVAYNGGERRVTFRIDSGGRAPPQTGGAGR
jgi:hypothetical protein